jgi:hypothetical protein
VIVDLCGRDTSRVVVERALFCMMERFLLDGKKKVLIKKKNETHPFQFY